MIIDNIAFHKIQYNSPQYIQALALRDKILRNPLGLSIYDDPIELEANDIHLGCFLHGKLIGVLILHSIDNCTVKTRQVAMDRDYQGMGLGSSLIRFSEKVALESHYKRIVLHARKQVGPFYTSLGYNTIGDPFLEIGIPHIEMAKVL